MYYRRYGNPNYGGMTGILSQSHRRRLRVSRSKAAGGADGDVRHVRILPSNFAEVIAAAYDDPFSVGASACLDLSGTQQLMQTNESLFSNSCSLPPERPLLVYDNLYEAAPFVKPARRAHHTGTRREAGGRFPVSSQSLGGGAVYRFSFTQGITIYYGYILARREP